MYELALRLIQETKEKNLRFLDLGNCGLTEIPEEVFELDLLEELNLGWWYYDLKSKGYLETKNNEGRNSITTITEKIQNLKRLKGLYLSDNQISDINGLKGLPFLSVLHLPYNQLSNISGLKDLPSLSVFDLSNNKLSDISALKELPSLTVLGLSSNGIRDISSLSELTSLTRLYLSANQINDISSLKSISSLSVLHLSYNQISDINALKDFRSLSQLSLTYNQIIDISALKSIIEEGASVKWENDSDGNVKLEGNPLTTPPPEIIKQGSEAILNYFKELELQGSEYLFEAKLLIIGEGGAGKTTLARKLKDENAAMPQEKDTTRGIAIETYQFKMLDGKDFQINIWDFGGQEIYHATHQFFLTKRSLYILVDDTRKDDKSVNDPVFNFWLQVAGLYGGGSPLLIVQNEKDERTKDLDLKGMKGRYDFIKDRFGTNLLTGKGLKEVEKAICYYIARLPHVGERLPKNWVTVRKELEEFAKKRDYISLDEYLTICSEHDIKGEEKALRLSSYLHDLGNFLHFQDDLALKNIFILSNQWATDAVYNVLDNEQVKQKNGYFTKTDLDKIWSHEKYRRHHNELLSLMMKFELCYEIKDPETAWLAPQLLPVASPIIDWDFETNLVVRYTYDFMPKGLLSRFIVRMQQYIKDHSSSWRSGVRLERHYTKALVIETYGSREIVIRVKGSSKDFSKELVTLIVEDFDKLHAKFENLKVKKLIPCNCRECQMSEKPYFYEYQNLIRRREKGVKTTQCEISFEEMDVVRLLDGVFTDVKPLEKDNGPLKVFTSYSHADEELKKELDKHLSSLKRSNKISFWDDRKILGGDDWDETIKDQVRKADIILLLISADFMASEYIWKVEINSAIERHYSGKAKVIPVFLRKCDYQGVPFEKLQGYPDNARPITSFPDHDEAFFLVSTAIRRDIESWKSL